jgi:hypothetical protein
MSNKTLTFFKFDDFYLDIDERCQEAHELAEACVGHSNEALRTGAAQVRISVSDRASRSESRIFLHAVSSIRRNEYCL